MVLETVLLHSLCLGGQQLYRQVLANNTDAVEGRAGTEISMSTMSTDTNRTLARERALRSSSLESPPLLLLLLSSLLPSRLAKRKKLPKLACLSSQGP